MQIIDFIKKYPERMNNPKYYIETTILFAVIHLLACQLGFLFTTSTQVSVIWPATGIGIFLLVKFGFKFWPAVSLGVLVSNIINGGNGITILGITTGSTLEVIVGAYLFNKIDSNEKIAESHRRTVAILIGAFFATLIAPTFGVASLCFANLIPWNLFLANWKIWFGGDYLGALVVLPILLSFVKFPHLSKKKDIFLFFLLFILSVFTSWFLFFNSNGAPYLILIFPVLLITIILLDSHSSNFLIFLLLFSAIISSRTTTAVFVYGDSNTNLIHLQLFIFGMTICNLFISDFKRINALKIPSLILLCGWIISEALFYSFFTLDLEKKADEFRGLTKLATSEIEGQFEAISIALKAGVGLLASSEVVTRDEWREFTSRLDVFNNKIGVLGIGVVYRVPNDKISQFEKNASLDNFPNFKVYKLGNSKENYAESYIITYLEPLAPNIKAVGLDLNSEINRKAAADAAVESGKVTLTSGINLVQGKRLKEGFLMFYPVYAKSLPHSKIIEDKKSRSIGWVYSPILSHDFYSSVLENKIFKDLRYSIVDSSLGKVIASSSDFTSLPNKNLIKQPFILGNKKFILEAKPSNSFIWNTSTASSWVAIASVILTLIVATFVSFIQTSEQRANLLVDLRTKQLDVERSKSVQASKLASLGEMSAGIAHEINNPLAIIQANALLLIDSINEGTSSNEDVINILKKINTTSHRITKIIKGLRTISRNADDDPFEPVNIRTIANDVAGICEQRLKKAEISFTLNIPEKDLIVECAPVQISQVLINLINNSHDAILELDEKWIKLELSENSNGNSLICSITDSGHGIKKEIAEKLMQPFFTTKEIGKGTGLGLSISLGIIEKHNGVFFLDDKCPNTKFVFEIPLKNQRA